MPPIFNFFIFGFIFILNSSGFPSSSGERDQLILIDAAGKLPDGSLLDPSKASQTANAASAAAAAAARGGGSAAQAIAAASEAGMMYRMLLAKGVMDYFQRKEMDRANQKMAEKMERLEKELQSGKLHPAQFAAIKAAVEEAYQKNAKSDLPKDPSTHSEGESSSKNSQIDLNFDSAKTQIQSGLGNGTDPSNSAPNPSDLAQLSNQKGNVLSDSRLSAQASGDGTSGLNPTQTSGAVQSVPSLNLAMQTFLPPSGMVQEESTKESVYREEKKSLVQDSEVVVNSESQDSGGGFYVDAEAEFMIEPSHFGKEGDNGLVSSMVKVSKSKTSPLHLAEISAGIGRVLKPIKFQKSPFSVKPYSEEEGLHWGFLVVGFLVAYQWGRKRNSLKNRIPHIIPEVVLEPQRHRAENSRKLLRLKKG